MTGVADDGVDAAVGVEGALDERREVVGVGDRAGVGDGVEVVGEREDVVGAGEEGESVAVGVEAPGDGGPHAPAGGGDERCFHVGEGLVQGVE